MPPSYIGGGSRKNSNNNLIYKEDEAYVEITLDVHDDDSIALHGAKPICEGANEHEDQEVTLLSKISGNTLVRRSSFGSSSVIRNASSSFGSSSVIRNASSKMKKVVTQELKNIGSIKKRPSTSDAPFHQTKTSAARTLKEFKFMSPKEQKGAQWSEVERRFNETSKDGLLPRSLFRQCVGMDKNSEEFALGLFDALTRRIHISRNSINKVELREMWEHMFNQSFDTRLQIFLDMMDKDGDGAITINEVIEIIRHCASANNLLKIKKEAEEYATLIMEELDPDNIGYIMIQDLKMVLLEAPSQPTRRTESVVISELLSQQLKPTKELNPLKRWHNRSKDFILDNWQRVWVLLLWVCITLGLFTYKFVQYRNKAAIYHVMGYCVCTAKGAAETLKFNMALILLPVCRNTMTWLRNKTKIGVVVPFDNNIDFHKVIAIGIAVGVALHAGAHLTCDFPLLLHASDEKYEPLKTYFGESQPQNYWWFVKGIEGVTGIAMVVLMAIAFTLATPWFRLNRINLQKPFKWLTGFNMFWYSHHLFIIVYALLIVHGLKLYLTKEWYKKTTWMYLAVPVMLYILEKLIRFFRSNIELVKIRKVAIYPENALALDMSKPQGFKYKSGQYMFIKCPIISPFEWHPFSITSAPAQDYLSLLIRTEGDWTKQLKVEFSNACAPFTNGNNGHLRANFRQGENNPSLPKVFIDGPYGAPAQDYKNYEIVLLVGSGIGATPMISIVKDIMQDSRTKIGSKIKKAYLYWVTREAGTFEWFKDVMNELVDVEDEGVIEVHTHCTGVYGEGDSRFALIAMLQSLNYAKNGIDVVSGTRVKTHFGRPNWREVFKRIAHNHGDSQVGVFYCGPPEVVKVLAEQAHYFTHKTSTRFDFHKENF